MTLTSQVNTILLQTPIVYTRDTGF